VDVLRAQHDLLQAELKETLRLAEERKFEVDNAKFSIQVGISEMFVCLPPLFFCFGGANACTRACVFFVLDFLDGCRVVARLPLCRPWRANLRSYVPS